MISRIFSQKCFLAGELARLAFFHMLVVGRVGRELASKHDDVGLLNEAKQQEASFCSLMMLLCAQLVLLCFATNGLILEAAVRRQPLFPNMYFPTRGVEKWDLLTYFAFYVGIRSHDVLHLEF